MDIKRIFDELLIARVQWNIDQLIKDKNNIDIVLKDLLRTREILEETREELLDFLNPDDLPY